MDNLPNCPFCRCAAYSVEENNFSLGSRFKVRCEKPMCGTTRWYDTMEEAVDAWIKHTGPLAKMNMGVPE